VHSITSISLVLQLNLSNEISYWQMFSERNIQLYLRARQTPVEECNWSV